MDLTDQDILHVAKLARLRLRAEALSQVRHDLNRVLSYVSQLQELPLDGVEPTMLVIGGRAPLRADDPRPSLALDAALNNGPEVRDNMFVVPRILEEGGTSG